ncbi:MAG: PQQ-binding-like beta-propeller repeat protein, partial [Pirellulales bacterium]
LGCEQSDFPFIADLDHDGAYDILVAVGDGGGKLVHDSKEVRRLDAETGEDLWVAPLRVRCAESSPERICLVGDLDADGVDDVAIASFYGEAKRDNMEAIRSQRSEVSVYIDVVSGRGGQRLSLAYQELGEVDQFTQAVEIDALRLVAPGVIETSLVWGDARERLLDSMSVRFSLTRDELPVVAPGLTALTRPSRSGGGFYLRRPGPDELGGETAVWIGHDSNGLLVAGYQWVLASWHNSQGVPRALLEDRTMSRLAAVEVPSGRVLWRQATTGTMPLARHLRRSNQDCLLVQTFDIVSRTCRLTCLDAETGRVRATLAKQSLGGMHDAAMCADGSDAAFLLTGSFWPLGVPTLSPGFHVRKIALDTGKTAWEKSVLSGLSLGRYAERPVKMLVADVDGDGTSDCIVPDESLGDAIRLVAISGRDGRELWSCETQLAMHEWPRSTPPWPLMELAASHEGQSHLVFMDKRGSDEILVRLLQLDDGREVDSRAYASQVRPFGHLANLTGLSLRVDRLADAEPTVTLVVPEIDAAGQLAVECSRLQIRQDRLHEMASKIY